MATKKKAKPTAPTFARTPKVPNFSEAAIFIADLCAKESWLGKSYETGKKKSYTIDIEFVSREGEITKESFSSHLSDEFFLFIFSTQLLKNAGIYGVKTYNNGDSINLNNFNALLDAAQLNSAINTNKSKIDIANGLKFLKNDLVKAYKQWDKDNYKNPNPDLAKEMFKQLSGELCLKENGTPIGSQPAVASRLLNFGFPDLCVYNYSTAIHRGLRLSNSDNALIDKYYALLDDGYKRNWQLLSKYELPISSKINDVVWQRARNGGWWQRRVYDLALKMYFSDDEQSYFSSFSPSVQEHIFIMPRAFD